MTNNLRDVDEIAKERRDYKTEEWRNYYREYRKKNLEKKREQERKSSKRRYEDIKKHRKYTTTKAKARTALGQAVYFGKIKKPTKCEMCGVELEKRFIHGHHEDYTKPYVVKWLCSQCHGLMHRMK